MHELYIMTQKGKARGTKWTRCWTAVVGRSSNDAAEQTASLQLGGRLAEGMHYFMSRKTLISAIVTCIQSGALDNPPQLPGFDPEALASYRDLMRVEALQRQVGGLAPEAMVPTVQGIVLRQVGSRGWTIARLLRNHNPRKQYLDGSQWSTVPRVNMRDVALLELTALIDSGKNFADEVAL